MKASVWASFLLQLAAAVALPSPGSGKKVNYDGYKLYRVNLPAGSGLEKKISELAAHVLNPGKAEHLDFVVAPAQVDAVQNLSVEATVLDEDIGQSIAQEGPLVPFAVPDASWFTAYHSFADHQKFIKDLQASFPSNSELINSGSSVQGRPIDGIHIWGSGGKDSKPAVLLHGTVHAREWITTMTTEYVAWKLLTDTSATTKAALDKFDYYIFPVVNPDGFVYSQTTDRLWRKNRQTLSGNSCVGRDINRNWPYKWEVTGGASTSPCSETYKGQAASDAPETKGLVSFVNKLRDGKGIRIYLDIHSYGQYILWPYGYSCSVRPENESALRSLASGAASAIRAVSGTSYTIGGACTTLYATTGDSTDYIDAVGLSTYTYTFELRDTGRYGFSLPASQIQPTAVETWAGILNMVQKA